MGRTVTLTVAVGLGLSLAVSALAQEVAPDIFLGARMGMSKVEFQRLPAIKAKPPRCLRFDLTGPPPARDVQTCDLPADEAKFARRYLFAPDPAGVTRLISISIIGHRSEGPSSLERLSARWGRPSGTTELKAANGALHVWSAGAQQLLLRYPCGGKDDLCIEYTDRPFARQATRASTTLLGLPGDRY